MTEIIEPARPPLPDPPEGYKWERKEIPLRYPRAITTRRGPLSSDGIGDNEYSDLPSAEELNGINRLGSTLASPSTEESRRQIDADELRIDLKAETGFSSYADYVNAYAAKIPYLENILNHLEIPSLVLTRFTILDLSKEESSRPRVIPRCYSQSAMSIVTSLRQPPANVAVQIVLWNSLEYVSDGLVSALGLGLKIDPRFFGALCNERRRHLGPKHVTIGGAVATVVRRYDPNKLDAVPIVFIARVHCEPVLAKAIEEEIGDTVPFQYPAIETYPFYSDPNVQGSRGEGSDTEKYDHPNYARLLKWCLEKEGGQAVGVTGSVLQPLIPLFYLNIFRVRNLCESIRHEYHGLDNGLASFNETERETVTSGLPKERLRLRVMVEDSEDALDHFLRYVDSQKSADLLSTKSWMKADEDIKRTHREAVRLEAQIRDYLQLQVGEWALQESKKSIELSNRQIEEGKRVKICRCENRANDGDEDINVIAVTILAFVYVPLNLATSIFGMNLSELNGSGQELWVFLTTAVIALVITGVSWFLIEEVYNYLRWQRSYDNRMRQKRGHDPRVRLTIGARMSMLALLWKYEHKNWLWRSGAWWRILTNNSSQLSEPTQADELNACEYVLKHMMDIRYDSEHAFKPDTIYEWK